PFHGWKFRGDGHRVRARGHEGRDGDVLRSWPVVEQENVVYCGIGRGNGEIELPQGDGMNGFESYEEIKLIVSTCCQEVAENFFDVKHFQYVHGLDISEVSVEEAGCLLGLRIDGSAIRSGSLAKLDTRIIAAGLGVVETTTEINAMI